MFCIICGAEISESEKNCPKCGAHVPVLLADPEGQTAELAVVPDGKNELAVRDEKSTELALYEPPKKNRKKLLIAIIALAVLIAGGITAAVLLKKSKDSDLKNSAWSETPKGKHISADALPYAPQLYDVLSKLYSIQSGDGDGDAGNYDSRKAADGDTDILYNILKTNSIAYFSIYPVDEPRFNDTRNGAAMDPWGKAATLGNYNEYYKESVIWIAQNIFNVSDEDLGKLTEKANSTTGAAIGYYLDKGKYYFYGGSALSKTKQFYEISIGDATYDGRYYYINYYVDLGAIDENGQRVQSSTGLKGYVVAELKDVDGEKFWSVYYHSHNIPKKLETSEYTEFKDIIGSACAKYTKDTGAAEKKKTSYTVTEAWSYEDGTSWTVQVFESDGGDLDQSKAAAYYSVRNDCAVYDIWDMSDDPKSLPVFTK